MDNTTMQLCNEQIKKHTYLIKASQQELDSANKSKAPQSTIKFIESRISALKGHLKRWQTMLDKETIDSGEQPTKANTTVPSGKKGKGKVN